ncbi:hypothetical protein Trydic_g19938 [Trypoxylus dichotomus]
MLLRHLTAIPSKFFYPDNIDNVIPSVNPTSSNDVPGDRWKPVTLIDTPYGTLAARIHHPRSIQFDLGILLLAILLRLERTKQAN